MHSSIGLLLAAATARVVASSELAMYWGANNQRKLAAYCNAGEGPDILILSFLNHFGNGAYPHGTFGECTINSDGSFSNCDGVASDIDTCHSKGKRTFAAIGGADTDWQLTSKGNASGVAYSLWNSYARPEHTSNSPRPFGNSYLDGWDIDIGSNQNNEAQDYLGTLVNSLRGYFPSDSSNTYYISGAPQCPLPEGNMGHSMMEAQYDYLWIQFYNNYCGAADLVKNSSQNPDGAGSFNFADWPGYLANGASANAKLHVGLPGDKAEAGDYFYIPSNSLPTVLANSEGVKGYNGFMIYDAGDSDVVNVNGCHYAQTRCDRYWEALLESSGEWSTSLHFPRFVYLLRRSCCKSACSVKCRRK
ncbi:putative chitinase 3 precursor [Cadophora sp. MPI-SDFR-AT-0126]|nr:putative chitinase 3 precursor [Leotiomycetes sp. MPI-SDFR-AT-0126]